MELIVVQCNICGHINNLTAFTKITDSIKGSYLCPICGDKNHSYRVLTNEKGYDSIHGIVLLVFNNFKVISGENMSDISRIFSLTPVQEDAIVTCLLQHGWITINGGMQMDID